MFPTLKRQVVYPSLISWLWQRDETWLCQRLWPWYISSMAWPALKLVVGSLIMCPEIFLLLQKRQIIFWYLIHNHNAVTGVAAIEMCPPHPGFMWGVCIRCGEKRSTTPTNDPIKTSVALRYIHEARCFSPWTFTRKFLCFSSCSLLVLYFPNYVSVL